MTILFVYFALDTKSTTYCKHAILKRIGSEVGKPNFLSNHKNDRIQYLLNCLCENNITRYIAHRQDGKKNSKISVTYRNLGNESFTSKHNPSLEKSVEFYAKSIAYAPAKTPELSIAYANRSAVLYKAGLISDCLSDINRAFENDYPDNLKSKLYLRKAMCLRALNSKNLNEIKKAFTETRKWMEEMDLKDKAIMATKLKDEEEKKAVNIKMYSNWKPEKTDPKLSGKNAAIPGMSDAIELKYNERFGRHMVAARNIKPGEILAVAKPYAKVVYKNMKYRVCWHCGQQTWAGLPCDNCAEVIYCSDACREQENLEHHYFECPIIGSMIAYQMEDVYFMSLRLAIKALKEAGGSIEALKENLKEIDASTGNFELNCSVLIFKN